MTEATLRRLFLRTNAMLEGHFKLSSGLHSDRYFQCALVLSDPRSALKLGQTLAALILENGWTPEVVLSPAIGGIVVGHEVARALGVRALFAERGADGALCLRRGFQLAPKERVLVIEDVITTGKSTAEVAALARGLGAHPVAAASLVLRAQEPPDLGVPLRSLAHWPARTYAPDSCPLCAAGSPVQKPGSRPDA
ncbi:MAG: orotate phosphoribosyltransferase [Elusimicrobiota bacterium]|jgi:orotate phosphoribosyltransferase